MRFCILLLVLTFLITGCQGESASTPSTTESTTAGTEASPSIEVSELFTDRDLQPQYAGTAVELSDASGPVTIRQEGVYVLSGCLTDGSVTVETDKQSKVQLVLDGVTIHCEQSAAIYVKQADKVFITLAPDSVNFLSCGESYLAIDENNIDSVIFSKEDLCLNGTGTLTINSPAGHGIVSKDDLRITGGSYSISAAGHGMTGKDAVSIANGSFAIEAGGDGIHAENEEDLTLGNLYIGDGTYQLTCTGDGISSSAALHMDAGNFTICSGGGSENAEPHTDDMFGGMGNRPGGMGGRPGDMGSFGGWEEQAEEETTISAKGIKSAGAMVLYGGTFLMNCADDAIHSNSDLTLHGGSYTIATGDDGLHADEALVIEGGSVTITESYEGLEGLTITVKGGQIRLKASDDGLNAAGGNDASGFGGMGGRPGGMGGFGGDMFGSSSDSRITISGGTLFVDADGDGIDSNGDLTFTGGYTQVEGPVSNGNGPLDYGGTGSISGGTVLITGSAGMAQTLQSTGNQGVIAINVGNCPAGTQVLFLDPEGNTVLSVQPEKAFGCVIVSCTELCKGESYTVQLGDQSKAFTAQ